MGKNILTDNQRRILDQAQNSDLIRNHFYLTGGTALSEFYYQHRLSEDLDFFSEEEISQKDITIWVKKSKKETQSTEVEVETLRGQFIYYFHFKNDVVKVDFAYFPFAPLGKFLYYKKLRISSSLDIAINKLQAILTRQRARDYVDLYEIISHENYPIDSLLKSYRLKFDITFPKEELAKRFSLVLDASDMPRFIGKRNWSDIEKFFLSQAKNLAKTILS